jgi:hypothetical protein
MITSMIQNKMLNALQIPSSKFARNNSNNKQYQYRNDRNGYKPIRSHPSIKISSVMSFNVDKKCRTYVPFLSTS